MRKPSPNQSFRVAAITAVLLTLITAEAVTASADEAKGEFGGGCVMGLALGKDIRTDCSVNTVYKGKTYCFGNETARTLFLKRPDDFLLQAHIYYSSRKDAAEEE